MRPVCPELWKRKEKAGESAPRVRDIHPVHSQQQNLSPHHLLSCRHRKQSTQQGITPRGRQALAGERHPECQLPSLPSLLGAERVRPVRAPQTLGSLLPHFPQAKRTPSTEKQQPPHFLARSKGSKLGAEALTRSVRVGQGQEKREGLRRRTEAAHLRAVTCESANIYSACCVQVLARKCSTWATAYLGIE